MIEGGSRGFMLGMFWLVSRLGDIHGLHVLYLSRQLGLVSLLFPTLMIVMHPQYFQSEYEKGVEVG